MRGTIIRKVLVVIIMIAPVFTVTDCRKQEKCGCDGDALFTLNNVQARVYFDEDGSNIYFTTVNGNIYDTYNFCNSTEMFPKLADAKSGDILLVSGQAFWDCIYLQQQSNYSYYSGIKSYQVVVTDVVLDLYGKGNNPKAE